MKVIGYRQVNFTAQDGNQVNGYTLFITEPFDVRESNCSGVKGDKFFVKTEIFEKLIKEFEKNNKSIIGSEIIVYYNRYGKPETIIPR